MGQRYYTYTAQELPSLCENMFHISPAREDTFIAGLSMGGYGAVRCALSRPEKYSACASFSGVLDLRYVLAHDYAEREKESLKALFGSDLSISPENDCYELARKAAKLPEGERPRFFLTCGEQDHLRDVNLRFRDFMAGQGFRLTYREWPGAHEWDFCDCSVKRAVEFFTGR
jgi:S-formylglutathione hydrolase FrmB